MIGRLFDAQRSVGSSQMHYCDSCQNTHYLTDGMLRILIYRIACRSFCLFVVPQLQTPKHQWRPTGRALRRALPPFGAASASLSVCLAPACHQQPRSPHGSKRRVAAGRWLPAVLIAARATATSAVAAVCG